MAQLFSHGQTEDLGAGRFRTTLGLKSVNYLANGLWRPITNRLGVSGDPALTVGVSELADFRLRDRIAGQSPLVHFGKGQSHVRFTPLGTLGTIVGQQIGDNAFEYPSPWVGTEYLRLTMGGHILRKEIKLGLGHPLSFAFRIDDHAGLDIDKLETPDFRILQPSLERGLERIPLAWAVSQQGGKTILTATLPVGNWSGYVLDPTLTLQPDATDGLDVFIDSKFPTSNNGSSTVLAIGDPVGDVSIIRALIKFDLTSIPSSSSISSAILSLYATVDSSNNARTFRVFRQKRAWLEAQATWNNYITGSAWQTAGGFGTDDCEQTDIGSRNFSATETLNEFKDFTLTPGVGGIQDMIPDGSFTNNGFLCIADTELDDQYEFASSDHATAANRPKLVVVYTAAAAGGAPPLRMSLAGLNWTWNKLQVGKHG